MPGLSIHQKAQLLITQARHNLDLYQRLYPKGTVARHADWTSCHTIIQSFDFGANPKLNPATAHAMGNSLFTQIQHYLSNKYGYKLDNGLISTHIDRGYLTKNHNPRAKVISRQPHLHSHIVIPNYNSAGQSISPYMRKNDLYQYQLLNDNIIRQNGLKDYYFLKLERQIRPFSSYTLNPTTRQIQRRNPSNLQRGWRAFKTANDFAWDHSKFTVKSFNNENFHKIRKTRDHYLSASYGYKVKKVDDVQTKLPKHIFTMDTFTASQALKTQWCNLRDLRILRWQNKDDVLAERLAWQLKLPPKLRKTPLTYTDYKRTVDYAAYHRIPDVTKIRGSKKRSKYRINLQTIYNHVKKGAKHVKKRAKTVASKYYQSLSRAGTKLFYKIYPKSDYNHHRNNFLAHSAAHTIRSAEKYHQLHVKRQVHQSNQKTIRQSPELQRRPILHTRQRSHDSGRER